MKALFRFKFPLGLLILTFSALILIAAPAAAQDAPMDRIPHGDQELFLSGMNLAWVNFARDLRNFDEPKFVEALDGVAAAKGNSIRWWLHTDGRVSPIYGDDGKVIGLGEHDIENMQRALDLAYERGILIIMCLWSHDMMKDVTGVPTAYNKLLIEDPAYTQEYIDNALTPMVTALAGHPGIAAWEVFNEPEGVTREHGWTDERTDMAHIQAFVNRIAGAIHRADPGALVTNGAWNMQVNTDIAPYMNYYRDDRLIAAGGDPDGTLDFYSVHYYPEWFDETTSPFHHPADYWELDKPIVVGEFPAAGLRDIGHGYLPRRKLMYAPNTYGYLFENGYAGALAWTINGGQHGTLLDASSGMLRIHNFLSAEAVEVNVGNVDHIPVVIAPIANVVIHNDTTGVPDYVDLATIFSDQEDGSNLNYVLTENSKPEVVDAIIENGVVSLNTTSTIGTSNLEITATDSGGKSSKVDFVVQVVDPNVGNVALGKPAVGSSVEGAFAPGLVTDGLLDTRSSTDYSDPQWLVVDLGAVFTINQVILRWEAAFGDEYDIQAWDGSAWQTAYHQTLGDGGIDDISLPQEVATRYVKMNGTHRGAEWGYSLWEFEVYGIRSDNQDEALQTQPPEWTAAEAAASATPEPVTTNEQLFSFESDAQGWGKVDFWAAITDVKQSTEMASDGGGSLAATGTYSGAQWEEGGVFLTLPESADWSASNLLTLDIYAPEGATNFLAQVYTKTGEGWTWSNTRDLSLTAGEWNHLRADLSQLGDLTDVREVGIKIGTGATAFTGTFYIDNIALATVAAPTEAPSAMESTTLSDFEDGTDGWAVVDFWHAITTAEPSTAQSSDGTQSLAVTGSYSGTQWEEGGVFFNPPEGTDWSGATYLTVDIFGPEHTDGFLAQVYTKTGADWTWSNTADLPIVPGWNHLQADLSQLGDLTDVREVGIKIGTSFTAFTGTFYIDHVVLETAAAQPSVAPAANPADLTESPLASFEDGAEGWAIVDFWHAITDLQPSNEMASDGSSSLALTGTFSGTQWEEGGIFIDPSQAADWSNAKLLTVDVYVPEGADGFLAQVYTKTGADWTWTNTPDIPLVAGQWNTLTADLSSLGDLSEVHEYGIKIGTSVKAFSGTFYVDNVRLLSE